MKLFRRKYVRSEGKGSDEIETFQKEIKVLNYTPVDYQYTLEYWKFWKNSEKFFRDEIKKIPINDLCAAIFNPRIRSETEKMKKSAKEQYRNHMQLIRHLAGILNGDLVMARRHQENLRQDLGELEKNLEKYKQLREAYQAPERRKDYGKKERTI